MECGQATRIPPRSVSLGERHLNHPIHAALTGSLRTPKAVGGAASQERLLLSATEAASLLGMSLRKFHQTRPELPAPVVIGPRHVRWRRADLDRWVSDLATVSIRIEPAQLTAGKLKRRTTGGAMAGSEFPRAQTQESSACQMSGALSNRRAFP